MASLLTTGRQIKGSALAGLTSVAQQEASQNIAEEQLKQAKEAQSQQLLGTGLGVAGAYAAPKIAGGFAAKAAEKALIDQATQTAAQMNLATGVGVSEAIAAEKAVTAAATEGTAAAGASGGATALLTNPYTYAAIAAAFLLKKIFD